MAQNEKKPFHEVIARELMRVPFGMTARCGDTRAGQANTLLTVLHDSEMPVAAANQVYDVINEIPEVFKEAGQTTLAAYAQEVIDDLVSRKDKPKN